VNLHLDIQLLRRIMLLVVITGLLVIAFGAYTLITAKNRYDELAQIPPPTQEELQNMKPGDPTVMALAAVERDKRDLQAQQGQATSIIGLGAILLGLIVVIYMRLPEQNSRHA
jgi:hypothetical protein